MTLNSMNIKMDTEIAASAESRLHGVKCVASESDVRGEPTGCAAMARHDEPWIELRTLSDGLVLPPLLNGG